MRDFAERLTPDFAALHPGYLLLATGHLNQKVASFPGYASLHPGYAFGHSVPKRDGRDKPGHDDESVAPRDRETQLSPPSTLMVNSRGTSGPHR
jgi:hypothetical protein